MKRPRSLRPNIHPDSRFNTLRRYRKVCGVCDAVTDYHSADLVAPDGRVVRCCVCSRCWSSISLQLKSDVPRKPRNPSTR